MKKVSTYILEDWQKQIENLVSKGYYESTSHFIRQAIRQKLGKGHKTM